MSDLFRRNLRISAAIHIAVILILTIVPAILSWRLRRKPHEMITYIDLQVVEPAPPGPPAVAPPPEPPKDIPEPPKKKEIKKSEKKIKRPDKKPPLSQEEIRKLLGGDAKPAKRAGSPVDLGGLPAWYYALVRQMMYEAWNQPGGLAATPGMITRVTIRIERDGRITRRQQIGSSGNRVMDDSVMQAVNSVERLKPLPSSYPERYKEIVIDFELTRSEI